MADNNSNDVERVWDLMEKVGFAMLVTRDGSKLRARPMSAYVRREYIAAHFLTDARRQKEDEGDDPRPLLDTGQSGWDSATKYSRADDYPQRRRVFGIRRRR